MTIANKILKCFVILPFIILFNNTASQADPLIADHTFTGHWTEIPTAIIDDIIAGQRLYYVHTSHGGQLNSGFTEVHDLDSRFPDLNYFPYQIIHNVGDDLGYDGDTSWAAPTRTYLDSHPECTMVMYSWCAGVSYNTENGINIYLNKVSQLEAEYPNVTFVYMTGHLDGTGPSGNLYIRNNQIRQYCIDNSKVLYDFADIESYDPDGNYYPDGSDACEWCIDWCAAPDHECYDDCYCEHSHCFNCRLKAQTWWVMMARLEGWNFVNVDEGNSLVPTEFNLYQNYPNPFNPSTAIKYNLPCRSDVKIDVYTVEGRYVETVLDETQDAGSHQIIWHAENRSSGVYFIKMLAGDYAQTKRMLLLK